MNDHLSGIYVARTQQGAFARVSGRGNYQNAAPLRQFGQEAIEQGTRAICLDLGQCQGMDSTFLGVLAGFGLKLLQTGCKDGLHLFNAGDRTLHSCQCLGLDRLAHLEPGLPDVKDLQPPPETDFHKLPDTDLTALSKPNAKDETAEIMLEAHEDLCRCDEKNEVKFKDVKECLREKLAVQTEPRLK